MEIIAIVVMLVAGAGIAVLALAATGISRAAEAHESRGTARPGRDSVAASLLFHVLSAGGCSPDEALKRIRDGAGLIAPVTAGIDVMNWAESFSSGAGKAASHQLLETAVRLISAPGRPIPLRQYAALLDLSFGLGFQTDALARLRAVYGFDYVDHAKDARPRGADRAGGATTLFSRDRRGAEELRTLLGVGPGASSQEIGAAYRRLAARHHPDRFHGASAEAEAEAAARFIEITRAYEELMALHRG